MIFKKKYNGLLPDTRSESEKAKDWQAEEVHGSLTPTFREVDDFDWKHYQTRSQNGSGSCVANTIAKMLEIKRQLNNSDSIKFSHAPIYLNRVNKPQSGMVGVDALKLAVKYSSCKEVDMTSENMSDSQLDALKLPANYEDLNNLVAPTNYLVCPLDFDYVASMVEKEGAVMIWIDSSYQAWCKDIPVTGGKGGGVRHSITVVDAIKLDGVEYLVVEDSWGVWKEGKYGSRGQRLITREFFNESVFFTAVLTEFKYDITDTPKLAEFKIVMNFGDKFDEVKRLQDFLKTQGVFPSNQESTGFYGNISCKAVYLFQIKNNVAPLSELDQLKGKRCGVKTLSKINQLIK